MKRNPRPTSCQLRHPLCALANGSGSVDKRLGLGIATLLNMAGGKFREGTCETGH